MKQASVIEDLPSHGVALSANALGYALRDLLARDPVLPGVMILGQNNQLLAIVGRARFHELLGHPYSIAVFMRRPIRVLLEHLAEPPLVASRHAAIEQVAYEAVIRREEVARDPVAYQSLTGEWRLVDVRALLVAQADLLRTALQDAERARQSRAMVEWKARSLAKISHEIRTPLHGILGLLELFDQDASRESLDEHLQCIRASGEQLSRALNDVLDHEKLEGGQLALNEGDCDLIALAEDALDSIAVLGAAQGLECAVLSDTELAPSYRIDPGRLDQVLSNLLSNAIKFTSRGHIVLSLKRLQSACSERHRVRIEVMDTGDGLDPAVGARLLAPATVGGSDSESSAPPFAIGLRLCRKIVQLLGGSLDFRSQPGQGTTFHFELDLVPSQPKAQPAARPLEGSRCFVACIDPRRERNTRAWLAHYGAQVVATKEEADFAILDREQAREAEGLVGILLVPAGKEHSCPAPEGFFVEARPIKRGRLVERLAHLKELQEKGPQRRIDVAEEQIATAVDATILSVLIVDDNAVNLAVLKRQIERRGHRVCVAKDGIEALNAAAAEDFDLILMDCHMPVLDGWQATEALRARESEAAHRFIFGLTASCLDGDRKRCLAVGMDGVATKPFGAKDLDALLREAEARRAGRASSFH